MTKHLAIVGVLAIAACGDPGSEELTASETATETDQLSGPSTADGPPGTSTLPGPGDETSGTATAPTTDAVTTGSVDDATSGSGTESGGTFGVEETGSGTDDTGGLPETCDPFAQDCPPGYKCSAYADDGGPNWNANACFPIAPDPAGVGEPCTTQGNGTSGMDDCELGAMCWDVDAQNNRTCVALCTGTFEEPVCAPASTSCAIANQGSLNLCLPTCDPLAQRCGGAAGCYPLDAAFHCAPDGSGGGGAQGDPCASVNGCDPGLACVGAALFDMCAGGACCSSLCSSDELTACSGLGPQWTCLPWFPEGMAPPGFETVGVCGIVE